MIFKIDLTGTVLWAKKLTGASYHCIINGVCPSANNGFMITGWSNINTGGYGSQLLAGYINNNGDIQWACTYSTNVEVGQHIIAFSGGKYIIAGYSSGFGMVPRVVKINATGDIQWGKFYQYSGFDIIRAMKPSINNGYYLSISSINSGDYSYIGNFIIKADSTGNMIWRKAYPYFDNFSGVIDLCLNDNNELVFTGYSGLNYLLLGQGSTNGDFCLDSLFSLSSSGSFTTSKQALSLTLSAFTVTDSSSLQSGNIIIQKNILCSASDMPENTAFSNDIISFPNPSTENLTIVTSEKSTIEIFNIDGQIIKTINTTNTRTTADLTDLSSGVFIVRVKTDKEIAIKKFIKQ